MLGPRSGVRLPSSFHLLALLAVGVFVQHRSVTAVNYKTVIRMERYGNCPDAPDARARFNFSEVVPYGRTYVGRGTFLIDYPYKKLTKVVARIQKCADRNDPNCELYQNWRFGEESCSLLLAKNAIWTPLFRAQPSLSCPFVVGAYQMENVTVDIEKLQMIKFPDKGYWKVSVTMDVDKMPMISCHYFELTFIKVRV
ncbi:uncharacterized protein LOC117647147 [Thrips palmi]|uniref:Uncharacterized protein LOC117647147 n=1 Tax=Thrips palmi TaxID=161013 RepID=A0A6P8Z3H2_THRPL|nr:uncharacterized protein LOC117647147 [Thrips palmi]